jgi:hypothetical protein
VQPDATGKTIAEVRRFLDDWVTRMKPLYMAGSFPGDFDFPERSNRGRLIRDAVLPACRDHNLPFGLMIGVRRAVNPRLKLAGDSVAVSDVTAVERLCAYAPENRFLVTMLARENQHSLCVAARKFSNLTIFGCWWFLNNPSIISEMTHERIEMLGSSFIPIHSDSRVLEQLIYKWEHSRRILGQCLCDSYGTLLRAGRGVTRDEIQRDVTAMVRGNFERVIAPTKQAAATPV